MDVECSHVSVISRLCSRGHCVSQCAWERPVKMVTPRARVGLLNTSTGCAGTVVIRTLTEGSSAARSPGWVNFLTLGGLGKGKPK